jgi:co-chaperonin GroES (HSP10)
MAVPQATNTFIYILRDATQKQLNDRVLPSQGQKKPHRGKLFSIGSKVTDKNIKEMFKAGGSGIFHQGVGQEIEIDGVNYLCLEEREIIGVIA